MRGGRCAGMLGVLGALLFGASPASAAPIVPTFLTPPGCDFLDPSVCLLPWPNDHFTRADPSTDTGKRLNLQVTAMPRNVAGKPVDPTDYNRNDGFSPGSAMLVKVPGLASNAALRRTGAVPITDMERAFDPSQPVVVIDADTGERQLVWAEVDENPPNPDDRVLVIRPGKNLAEGHRFIVALRRMRRTDGAIIPAREPFRIYRDKVPTLSPAVEGRRRHFEDIFARLAKAGIARHDLHIAWDFTVASERDRSERMLHIRDDAFTQLGDANLADLQVPADSRSPAFTVDQIENFTPAQDSRIARRVTGTVTVPCYLNLPGCPPGSRFILGLDGLPVRIPGNTVTANYICNIPRVGLDGPAPMKLRPTLYGHGLLGDASEVNQGQQKSLDNEHGFMSCATDWIGMSTLDIPNVVTILADVSNFPTLADRVQQGMLNFLFLGRTMLHAQGFGSHPAFQAGNGQSVIDGQRLFYDGNSQGGIIGGALIAVAPDLEHGVIGVNGMNYSTLLQRSVDFEGDPATPCPAPPDQIIGDLPDAEPDPEYLLELLNVSYSCPLYITYPQQRQRQLLLGLLQQLWDRAEANGYAHHMGADPYPNTPPHKVLMHVAFGDHQVANVTAEVEARTMGAAIRPTPLDPGRHSDVDPYFGIERATFPWNGSLFEIWDSGTPTPPTTITPPRAGEDPHEEPRNTIAARQQKSAFLRVGGTLIDACNGGPCYSRGYTGAR